MIFCVFRDFRGLPFRSRTIESTERHGRHGAGSKKIFGEIRVYSRAKEKHMKEETENTEQIVPQVPDPEVGELRAENEKLKEDIRMRTAVYDIEASLTRAGARSPKLLVEAARESLQFGEDGSVANAAAVVDHLRRQFPEQFGAGSIDGGAGRNQGPTLTKDALAKMTPAEIQRLDWAEVRSVLAQ